MKELQEIPQAAYLTLTNAAQYRRIMRIFYLEYEKMNFQLYKEDVFRILKEYPNAETYTIEQLVIDLNVLVERGNLTQMQDPRHVTTIADYKNKQFRYAMSEYSVEIERLTVRLENLFMESGRLSANLFLRIHEALAQTMEMKANSPKEINAWWHNLQEDFRRLNQNYQDYLREFYAGKSDKLLKSLDLILHKDLFITYLKDFIQEMQKNLTKIESALHRVSDAFEHEILERIVQSELAIPHPTLEQSGAYEAHVREVMKSKWMALKRWFISTDQHLSESQRVLDITNEVIRKIIQNAALIVQLQNWGISRKSDYMKFITMFLDCEDIDEAHKLSAHVFGIQNIRHFKVNAERSTDSINSSTYDEEPAMYTLKPHSRQYQPRVDKTGFGDKSKEKNARRMKYLARVEADKRMVLEHIQDHELDLSKIKGCVSVHTRRTLLRWIAAANAAGTKRGRTEYGQEYTVTRKSESCTLRCEDGDLVMPVYIFHFKERK